MFPSQPSNTRALVLPSYSFSFFPLYCLYKSHGHSEFEDCYQVQLVCTQLRMLVSVLSVSSQCHRITEVSPGHYTPHLNKCFLFASMWPCIAILGPSPTVLDVFPGLPLDYELKSFIFEPLGPI